MEFDYGKTLPDGQHERYPTNTEGEFVAPVRDTYMHKTCGGNTWCSAGIAETYAKNPKYYGRTYCSTCHEHYPVSEFVWTVDNVPLGEIGDASKAGLDMRTKGGHIK